MLFIYFWLHRVLVSQAGSSLRHAGSFVTARGLLSSCGVRVFSLVVARGLCSLRHAGSLLRSTSSVVAARGLSCPVTFGILVP